MKALTNGEPVFTANPQDRESPTQKIGEYIFEIITSSTNNLTGAGLCGTSHASAHKAALIAGLINNPSADQNNDLPPALKPIIPMIRMFCTQRDLDGFRKTPEYYELATFISTCSAGFLFKHIETLSEDNNPDEDTKDWLTAMVHALQTCKQQITPDVFEKLGILYECATDKKLKSEILHVFIYRFEGIMQWGESGQMVPSQHLRELPILALEQLAETMESENFEYGEEELYSLTEALGTLDDYMAINPPDKQEVEKLLQKIGAFFERELIQSLSTFSTAEDAKATIAAAPDEQHPDSGLHDTSNLDTSGLSLRKIILIAQLLDRLYYKSPYIKVAIKVTYRQPNMSKIGSQYIANKGSKTAFNPIEKCNLSGGAKTYAYLLIRQYVLHDDMESLEILKAIFDRSTDAQKRAIISRLDTIHEDTLGDYLYQHPEKRTKITQKLGLG